jgi:hypothetical protein
VVAIGVVAFLGGYLRASNGAGKRSNPPVNEPRANQSFDRRARLVAEKFILTAVARKNTAASWTLVDLSYPGRSVLTKREWVGDDIPVVPASFSITKNDIRLSVAHFTHMEGSSFSMSFSGPSGNGRKSSRSGCVVTARELSVAGWSTTG